MVHFIRPPCCLVAFLTIYRYNTFEMLINFSGSSFIVVSVSFNRILTLNKHTTGTIAEVKNSVLVRFEHFNQQSYYGTRRIELPAFFPFGKCKLFERTFIYLPEISSDLETMSPNVIVPIKQSSHQAIVCPAFLLSISLVKHLLYNKAFLRNEFFLH